jgi:hypothetical protein
LRQPEQSGCFQKETGRSKKDPYPRQSSASSAPRTVTGYVRWHHVYRGRRMFGWVRSEVDGRARNGRLEWAVRHRYQKGPGSDSEAGSDTVVAVDRRLH